MSELVVTLLRRARLDGDYRRWLRTAMPEELTRAGLKLGQQAVLLSNLLLTDPFDEGDLPDWEVRYGDAFPWMDYRDQVIPWTPFTMPMMKAKVALITTAGIYCCEDRPFATQNEEEGDPTYRVIPGETLSGALCVKHHLALVQAGPDGDTSHLFPLEVARQLRDEGVIGLLKSRGPRQGPGQGEKRSDGFGERHW